MSKLGGGPAGHEAPGGEGYGGYTGPQTTGPTVDEVD